MRSETKTPNCSANHAIFDTLRDGFALALRAEGRSPRTLWVYLDAVDQLRAFADERGMPDLPVRLAERAVGSYQQYPSEEAGPYEPAPRIPAPDLSCGPASAWQAEPPVSYGLYPSCKE